MKALNQAVTRNDKRFPLDFMFELTKDESENLRSQFGTSSWCGSRYLPMACTEQGVAMLSGTLTSDRAIKVNIAIIRQKIQKALNVIYHSKFSPGIVTNSMLFAH